MTTPATDTPARKVFEAGRQIAQAAETIRKTYGHSGNMAAVELFRSGVGPLVEMFLREVEKTPDETTLGHLASLATEATRTLQNLAEKSPDAMRFVARTRSEWPRVLSPRPSESEFKGLKKREKLLGIGTATTRKPSRSTGTRKNNERDTVLEKYAMLLAEWAEERINCEFDGMTLRTGTLRNKTTRQCFNAAWLDLLKQGKGSLKKADPDLWEATPLTPSEVKHSWLYKSPKAQEAYRTGRAREKLWPWFKSRFRNPGGDR